MVAPTLNAHLAAAFNAPSDHPFTDARSARPIPPTRQPIATPAPSPCTIPQPAIPGGPALCPDAKVPTPSLDSTLANIAAEPFTVPPQAGSRRAAPQRSRVSPGRVARGRKACPSGQSSPYVLATVPPARVPPTTWVALARSTNSTPGRMPVSMPGTKHALRCVQGSTQR
jgi:hypothetical protein